MAHITNTFEADNRTGINHEGPKANLPVKRLTATTIIGDAIENHLGEDLGTIDNLMVNLHTGEIEYAVVAFGSFLGIGGKLFAIPFSELVLDPQKAVFVLNRDRAYLKAAPGFDQGHWPDTNDQKYFNDVKTYYGVVPPFP